MELVLHYRGPLKANGRPDHKHDIRRVFHQQLAVLWGQPPLSSCRDWLEPRAQPGMYSLRRDVSPFVFAPLITEEMSLFAEVELELLRPEPPGRLLTQGGDIDNRLKTLFDALTMPRHSNAMPENATPQEDEHPFFCVLEDDNLVTSLSVRTSQLLEACADRSLVVLVMRIRIGRTRGTVGNGVIS